MQNYFHLLKWLIPNSILIFVAIGAWHFGFLFQLYSNDRSYISTLITIVYLICSFYCLYRLYFISNQINLIIKIKNIFEHESKTELLIENDVVCIKPNIKLKKHTQLNDFFKNIITRNKIDCYSNNQTLLEIFADKLSSESKIGSFVSDALFKLGLLGTIIGFVLMLQPISSLNSFDEIAIKNALTSMTAGMSIALFTTLAGLVGGLLLKIQYYFLESATSYLFYNTSEVSEIFLTPKSHL